MIKNLHRLKYIYKWVQIPKVKINITFNAWFWKASNMLLNNYQLLNMLIPLQTDFL